VDVNCQGFPEVSFGFELSFDRVYPNFPGIDFGGIHAFEPLFAVDDKHAVSVGYLKDTDKVALAYKTFDNFTSWFCSIPITDTSVLRRIFEMSGAHIYSDYDDVIYSGGGILCIHSKMGGERVLRFSGALKLTVDLAPDSTTIFDLDTGNILL